MSAMKESLEVLQTFFVNIMCIRKLLYGRTVFFCRDELQVLMRLARTAILTACMSDASTTSLNRHWNSIQL